MIRRQEEQGETLGQTFIEVSMRKARQVVVNSLQLAHLNSMGSAWCMGTASDCLVSGPTSVQGMGEYWPDVWSFDEMVGDMGSGLVGLHVKSSH